MIVATHIPVLTERMRPATIRAAERRSAATQDRHLTDELERRGYRVTRMRRPA